MAGTQEHADGPDTRELKRIEETTEWQLHVHVQTLQPPVGPEGRTLTAEVRSMPITDLILDNKRGVVLRFAFTLEGGAVITQLVLWGFNEEAGRFTPNPPPIGNGGEVTVDWRIAEIMEVDSLPDLLRATDHLEDDGSLE